MFPRSTDKRDNARHGTSVFLRPAFTVKLGNIDGRTWIPSTYLIRSFTFTVCVLRNLSFCCGSSTVLLSVAYVKNRYFTMRVQQRDSQPYFVDHGSYHTHTHRRRTYLILGEILLGFCVCFIVKFNNTLMCVRYISADSSLNIYLLRRTIFHKSIEHDGRSEILLYFATKR